MSKINKYNEFLNNEELIIKQMIEECEWIPFGDLEEISKTKPYREVVKLGEKIIPYLLERDSVIWDRALSELTGCGLNPLEYDTIERREYWRKWAKENEY
jgi:hypothetical protein